MKDSRFCYVTTTGRITGRPHEIEIWFVARGETVYILMGSGERADTVRNIRRDPGARVRIDGDAFDALGRVVDDPDEAAWVRAQLPQKYAGDDEGLEEWAQTALPVAFDLTGRSS